MEAPEDCILASVLIEEGEMDSMRALVRLTGLMLLLLGAMPLTAQINRGVIEGLVTDPQGAVMAGVQAPLAL